MFYCLKDAGINDVYRKAALILETRGMSKMLMYDPYTKSVDVEGAILLACGASEKLLDGDEKDLQKIGIPEAHLMKVIVGLEYIEAMINGEIADWCSTHETYDAVQMLNRLADRIDISVVKQTG